MWDYDQKKLVFTVLEPKKERRKGVELEKYLKKVTTENFPTLAKDINLYNQEAEQMSNRINPKKSVPRFLKAKDKEILKAARER